MFTKETDNSRFYLKQGFLTLGNLNKMPVYITAGQIYVPFGTKSTDTVTGPLTGNLTDTKQRALLIGFKHGNDMLNYNAAVYGFNSSYRNDKHDGGAKVGINFSKSGFSASASGGIISNVFESEVFQNSGDEFVGFALYDRVKAADKKPQVRRVGLTAFAKIGYKNITLKGEYFTVSSALPKKFFVSGKDGKVKPKAFYAEMSSEHKLHSVPTLFAIGYGQTSQAQVIEQDKRKMYASVIIEPIKSTLLGVEFSRAQDYSTKSSVKTWGYDEDNGGALTEVTGTGKWKNSITMFFGYFF
ncbi:MAG: LbtU family siderophore porin [Legionellales bacterium]|nr:LbtU family siderophore porin [Legionellales bacterium]